MYFPPISPHPPPFSRAWREKDESGPALEVRTCSSERTAPCALFVFSQHLMEGKRSPAPSEGTAALDAVEAAVRVLEDDTFFNAGQGSVLTNEDTVQMDALVSAFTIHRVRA